MSAVRAWDRGTHRVPWSAVKLLRLYRRGDLGALRPEWRGWTLNRNGLVSPEGVAYNRGDLGWWSLTCRQAEAFRRSRAAQRRATGRSVSEPPEVSAPALASLASLPVSVLGVDVLSDGGSVRGPQASARSAPPPGRGLSALRNK